MKTRLVAAMVLGWVAMCMLPAVGFAQGSSTLLVVPARYSVIQVAFDMAQRFPVTVVSYQGDATTEAPVLHAWNGSEWVALKTEDYEQGSFLQATPARVVVVGDEKLAPPMLTSAVAAWCPQVDNVASVETAPLVNEMGKIFDFSSYDWSWFAKRYNLTLQDQNAERRSKSWYDRPSYEDKWSKSRKQKATEPAPAGMEMAPAEPVPAPVIESEAVPVEAAPVAEAEVALPVEAAPAEVAPAPEQAPADEAYPLK